MKWSVITVVLAAIVHAYAIDIPSSLDNLSATELASLGSKAFQSGQREDAVRLFDASIHKDPLASYSTYHLRSSALMSLGRWAKAREALDDTFNQISTLSTKQKGQLQVLLAQTDLKLGDLKNAESNIQLARKNAGPESHDKINEIDEYIKQAKRHYNAGMKLYKKKNPSQEDYANCAEEFGEAIKTASLWKDALEKALVCNTRAGNWMVVNADISRLLATSAHRLDYPMYARQSFIKSIMQVTDEEAFVPSLPNDYLDPIKKCISLDPDAKVCLKLRKQLRSIHKDIDKLRHWVESEQWGPAYAILGTTDDEGLVPTVETLVTQHKDDFLESMDKPVEHSDLVKSLKSAMCRVLVNYKPSSPREEKICESILSVDENNPWALYARGLRLRKEEKWLEAIHALKKARDNAHGNKTIEEALDKTERLYAQSKKKDYYKVLGVSRDATEKQIKKAYRKATLKAHPDKGGSEEKMAAVNEAYETLSDPEKRKLVDMGVDPNDPTAGQAPPGGGFHADPRMFQHMFQQGGFQFQQGGFPFGAGGGGGGGGGFPFGAGGPGGGGFKFHFGG